MKQMNEYKCFLMNHDLPIREILIATVSMIGLFVTGCRRVGEASEPKSKHIPAVKVEAVTLKTMTRNIALTGSIEPSRVARIASPAEGPVLQCSIREGDRVKQDQVLITLGRNQAAEELAGAAREVLDREEEDLQKIEQLVRSGAIPAEQKDEARLRVVRARAQLSKALENVKDYQIRAPWAGIVSKVFVTDGYFVSPRQTLVEMFDPESLGIRFAIPEKEAKNVRIGMELTATLDAYSNRVYRAKISRCYPELDRKMHTRTVEASLVEEINLVPGMFARISIPVQMDEDAVILPDASIVLTPQGERVVFIVKDGRAIRRTVNIGREQGQYLQIMKGIDAGDSVVVAGNQNLKNNMDVRIVENE